MQSTELVGPIRSHEVVVVIGNLLSDCLERELISPHQISLMILDETRKLAWNNRDNEFDGKDGNKGGGILTQQWWEV